MVGADRPSAQSAPPERPARPNAPASSTRRRGVFGAIVRWIAGIGLAAAVVAWLSPSAAELWERVDVNPGHAGLGLLASSGAALAVAARWKRLTEAMGGDRLPFGVYFHHLTLTRVLGLFAPTLVVDLVGRPVALRSAGSKGDLVQLMAPVVLERILDLVLPLVMLGWAIAVAHSDLPLVASLGVVAVAFGVTAVPALRPMVRGALWIYGKVRRSRASLAPPTVSRRLATEVALLSMARYACVVGQYWAVGAAVGVLLSAQNILSATPVAQLAGLIGVTPGGLGIQELGWSGALRTLGVGAASTAVFVLAARVLVAINFVLLALISRPLLWRHGARPR